MSFLQPTHLEHKADLFCYNTEMPASLASIMDYKKQLSAKELMLLDCGLGENSWESLGQQGDPTGSS